VEEQYDWVRQIRGKEKERGKKKIKLKVKRVGSAAP
jgi:hypothetical protein